LGKQGYSATPHRCLWQGKVRSLIASGRAVNKHINIRATFYEFQRHGKNNVRKGYEFQNHGKK